jgi:oligoribonuclease NrnB/cAMP/cGMP phosphodiesterase (DHH superfamily)
MDLIYYHAQCTDGWCAAYIASKRYPEARLVPAYHSTEPPYVNVEGKDVLMVDFCWKTLETNAKLGALAKSLTIIDHHRTAKADIEGLPNVIFDLKRSGAGLTWDYLFGKDAEDLIYRDGSNFQEERPWYVNYVEDRDLWNNKLPDTKEVSAYLKLIPHTVEAWNILVSENRHTAVTNGAVLLIGINNYVDEIVQTRRLGTFHGRTVGIVNAPFPHASEIGHELAKESEISMSWYERQDGKISFSMRSIGNIDVSAIAKLHGGGGHINAAGFEKSLQEGRILIDQVLGRNKDVRSPGGCIE